MAEFLLGMSGKIYYGTAGVALTSMTELTNARDVTLTLEAGEADVTTRANLGWRATAPTLREASAEFEMVWKPGEAGFEAIKDAYLANLTIELAILDGDKGDTGGGWQGPKGSFSITSFSRSEPLEEAMIVSVSAKLSTFEQWVVI